MPKILHYLVRSQDSIPHQTHVFLRVWVLILHLLDLHPAEEAWPGAVRVSYQGNVTSKKQNDTTLNGIGRL